MRTMIAEINFVFLLVKLIGLFPDSVVSVPSKPTRRFVVSSNRVGVEPEPEPVVRIPLRKVPHITEQLIGQSCQNDSDSYMSLYKLVGQQAATCNDGSASGYYLLRRKRSKKWVIFLEGGWYCADETTCKLRQIQEPRLTSSQSWNHCKEGKGIYSVSSRENPYLHNSNMVYLPYCSSDLWSGTAKRRLLGDEPFSFMGSLIVKQVVQQLLDNHDLRDASVVILAGSSAGGTGVLLNIDPIQKHLKAAGSLALVRGVSDSAWYLKRPEMERSNPYCSNPFSCSPVSLLKMGMSLWKPNLPQRCLDEQRRSRSISPNSSRFYDRRRNGKWKCFFGPVLFPYIEAEVFVVQFLFDSIQIQNDHVSLIDYDGDTNSLLRYIKSLFDDLNDSFASVTGLFVTSCFSHAVLDSSDWYTLEVSHVSLPGAIRCWEANLDRASEEANSRNLIPRLGAESPNSVAYHNQLYNQAELYHEEANERDTEFSSDEAIPDDDEEGYEDTYYNEAPKSVTIPTQCKQRVVDPCPLPQCNPTCRPFYHSVTHILFSRIDFLERLGIKIRQIARQRGLNVAQLLRDLNQI